MIKQRNICWLAAFCLISNNMPAHAADENLQDMHAMTKALVETQSKVKAKVASKANPEDELELQYSQLQSLCAAKVNQLDQDFKRYTSAEARTNVIGSLITLVGSVTAYAPGKVVLMGLGISSSGTGTVASGITQFFSTRSTLDSTALASLQAQLNQVFDRYDSVVPTDDPHGVRRSSILARGTNVCLGLAPAVAPPDPKTN